MNDTRKRLLALLVGGIVLYFGGDYVLRQYFEKPLEQKKARLDPIRKKIKAKRRELTESKAAAKRLTKLEQQSLPGDIEIARSLYRAWLLDLVDRSDFQSPHVDSGAASSRKGFYESLGFTVRGKGTLHQIVRFLYDFYHAGHLHKIQSLSLTPLGKGGGLDVTMTIEALVLSGTNRKDELSTLTSDRLKCRALDDYAVISQRNIFGVGGEADESRQAFLTAITRDGDELEIWITVRNQDKLLKLQRGGEFDIGHFHATVIDIQENDVVFESFGERWLLSIGESIADSLALPPEY